MHDEPPAIEGHTSRTFDGELASLHLHVVQMGGLVLRQVHDAAHAYTEWQPEAGTAGGGERTAGQRLRAHHRTRNNSG